MSRRFLQAIDVCCGGGGWACAARGLPIRIVAAIDIAEDCLRTYAYNHPGVETIRADVREFDFRRFAGIDVMLGGIPCEQISTARRGVKLSPADLAAWHELIDACLAGRKLLKPRYWCFEDVQGLWRHLPAFTPYRIIESAQYCAQRRKRLYVGEFPNVPRAKSPALFRDHMRPGPHRLSERTMARRPGRSHVYGTEQFYPWMPDEKSPTVTCLCSRHDNYAAVVEGKRWRQLEWQELATLQGFPPDYVFVGSPTRVFKMVAQAIQVDTGRAILRAMVRDFLAPRANRCYTGPAQPAPAGKG